MYSDRRKRGKLFYGYIVTIATFLIQLLSFGLHPTFGIFFVQLSSEFGWTRAVTSGSYSLNVLTFGLLGIVGGKLNDRFSPRFVMTIFFILFGLGYALMSQINSIWQFYLFYGVILGTGMGGTEVPVLSTLARWFVKKRGIMTGIAKVGAGLGALSMPFVTYWLISSYGWRNAYLVVGLASMVILISAAQFLKRDPSQIGQLPDGDTVIMEDSPALEIKGLSTQQAIHTRQFWLIGGMFFFYDVCVSTIMIHIYPHAIDLGIPASTATNFLASAGGVSIVGRVVMGSASDRIGNKLAIIIDLSILSVSLLWLLVADEVWMLYLFAALYGFAYGGLFTLLSPMVAKQFGLDSHGTIFGSIFFIGLIGASISPVTVGYIFDVTGSYHLGFILIAVASIIATSLMVGIKNK